MSPSNGRRWLALIVAMLLGACAAPSRIVSNKVQDYSSDPKRLFVISELPYEWGPEFTKGFYDRLIEVAKACGAALDFSPVSALELDNKARENQMRRFRPDGVLVIRRNGGTKDQYGGLLMSIFDARFIDTATDKVVWRSATNFGRAYVVPAGERGATFAVELTNKLKADGIFRSCPQVPTKAS